MIFLNEYVGVNASLFSLECNHGIRILFQKPNGISTAVDLVPGVWMR